MTDIPRIERSSSVRPHAYDPVTQPEYFRSVLLRRVLAFMIDLTILVIEMFFLMFLIFIFGFVSLGLGWILFAFVGPIFVISAIIYFGATLGSPASATLGMRAVELEMRTWYGSPMYFLLGAVHAVLFWITVSVFSPLILIVGLLNGRKRLLHDFICGTVVVNTEARAAQLRRPR
jgi:uncharacterized RDD family membrane protein YckC